MPQWFKKRRSNFTPWSSSSRGAVRTYPRSEQCGRCFQVVLSARGVEDGRALNGYTEVCCRRRGSCVAEMCCLRQLPRPTLQMNPRLSDQGRLLLPFVKENDCYWICPHGTYEIRWQWTTVFVFHIETDHDCRLDCRAVAELKEENLRRSLFSERSEEQICIRSRFQISELISEQLSERNVRRSTHFALSATLNPG